MNLFDEPFPVSVAGKRPRSAICTSSAGVTYAVPKGAIRLRGQVGFHDSEVPDKDVRMLFFILGDGSAALWKSPKPFARTPGLSIPFDVDVRRHESVTLSAKDVSEFGGSGNAVWIDTCFEVVSEQAVRLGVRFLRLWDKEDRDLFTAACARNNWPPYTGLGLVVRGFDDMHADGIQEHDIIVRIDGKAMRNETVTRAALNSLRKGKKVRLEVLRLTEPSGDKRIPVTVDTVPVTESAIRRAEAAEIARINEEELKRKVVLRATGETITIAAMNAHNTEVAAALRALGRKVRFTPHSDDYPIASGVEHLANSVRALQQGEGVLRQLLRERTAKSRLAFTEAIVNTPVRDLWREIRGEVWSGREVWELCERLHR